MTTNCSDSSLVDGFCYQIISANQLEISLIFSAICGALVMIVFFILRGHSTWKPILHKRAMQIPDLLCRPPPLNFSGLKNRLFSWLNPTFALSDTDLLTTSGLDALMLIRLLQLGIQICFPLTIIVSCSLLPIYYTADGLITSSTTTDDAGTNATYSNNDVFMLRTLSNVPRNSQKLWAPWVMMIVVTWWCLYCLWCHCKSYAVLRLLHMHGSLFLHELEEADDVEDGEDDDGFINTTTKKTTTSDTTYMSNGPVMRIVGGKRWRGGKAAWRAAGMTFLRVISPMTMLKADNELVQRCLAKFEARMEAEKKRMLNIKNTTTTMKSTTADVLDDVQGNEGGAFSSASSLGEQNNDATIEDSSSDEIEEVVRRWWLSPEEIPESINPILRRGGILLGKTHPELRSRVKVKPLFNYASSSGSGDTWGPAAAYVVLFRTSGPTPINPWGSLLDIKERFLADVAEIQLMNAQNDDNGAAAAAALVATDNKKDEEEYQEAAAIIVDNDDDGKISKGTNETTTTEKKKKKTEAVLGNTERGQFLEATLKRLYPSTFEHLVHVYPHKPTDMAIQRWDVVAGHLEVVTEELARLKNSDAKEIVSDGGDVEAGLKKQDETGVFAAGGKAGKGLRGRKKTEAEMKKKTAENTKTVQKLHAQYEKLTKELAVHEQDVAAARAAALSSPLGTAYFAVFTSQRDALSASQGNIGGMPQLNMTSEMAPKPDEINWEGLWAGWGERTARTILLCGIPMVIICLFPIGALTGALTNLEVAVCGGTPATNSLYWPWLCTGTGIGEKLVKTLLTGILPVVISTFYDTWVMPLVLYIIMQAQRCHASFSALEKAIIRGFYAFSVLNTFLGAVLGGTFLQQLGVALSDGDIVTLLGTALPSASNFFLNYIAVHALFTNLFRFVWPHDGTILFVFFRAVGLFRPKCKRDEWIIRSAPSYRGGRHYGAILAIYVMVLSYAVIAPIILPLTCAYFFTAYLTWRYSAFHFYEPCYEGGGRVFELIYNLLLITVAIANAFAALVIVTKGLFWIGGSTFVIGMFSVLLFWRYCDVHVMKYAVVMPMQVADLAATARVPVEMYMPPPLRRGAVGYAPEWGKMWYKYGLPAYSTIFW